MGRAAPCSHAVPDDLKPHARPASPSAFAPSPGEDIRHESPAALEPCLAGSAPSTEGPWLVDGRTSWRREHADRLAFLIDGEAYFGAVRTALASARHSFYILGWDISSTVRLCPGGAGDGLPEALGPFLSALVKRRTSLHGHLLGWDYAMLYAFEREWWSALRFRGRRLAFEMDARHPLGASHHQKVIVVDDRVAFVSGFDLAPCRWDTSEHACESPLRKCAGKAYGPFHDVGLLVEGDCARALGELCRARWSSATGRRAPFGPADREAAGEAAPSPDGEDGSPPRDGGEASLRRADAEAVDAAGMRAAAGRSAVPGPWPAQVVADLSDVMVGIARTAPAFEGEPAVTEVRELYLDAIARARDFVFAENQYFTSNIVARAMAKRLAERTPPEMVLLVPANESGWIETSTMGVLRARVHAKLRAADPHARYGLYCPRHACDEAHPKCINVHSKVLIVDDELLTVGSANLSDRSMCYDTECNLALEARGDARVRAAIAGLRARLLGEHLGVEADSVLAATAHGESLHGAVRRFTNPTRRHLEALEPHLDPTLDALLPEHDVVDPAEPLDAEAVIADVVKSPRKRRSLQARVAIGVVAVIVIVGAAMAWRYALPATPEVIAGIATFARAWQASAWPAVALLAAYVLGGFVLVPLTLLIAITAALFGPLVAIPLALTGALASAATTFHLARRFERGWLRRHTGPRFDELAQRLAQRGLLAVLVVRLLPIAPFSVVNAAAGVARIGWRDFLLGTLLGVLPGIVLTSALIDRVLAALAKPTATHLATLALVLAVILVAGWALHRKFDRHLAS